MGFVEGPFVTIGICLDGITNEKVRQNLIANGDYTDMCTGGYFLRDDGSVYRECMSNYIDLEFYDKELTGSQRTLIAISNCMKRNQRNYERMRGNGRYQKYQYMENR